jgi:O-glycosyl hydrolase
VTVQIAGSDTHQTMEGFGATTSSLAYDAKDNVRADLRPLAIQAAYRDVGLNMGNLSPEPCESSPSNVFSPANDDSDPLNLNANGFNWIQSDNMVDKIVTPAKQYGFDAYYLGPVISTTFSLAWVNALRSSSYDGFLNEIAEHVVAIATHWRDAYGITPRFLQLWNEPLSGNGELVGGSPQELVDIVKRAGARLQAAGITPRFVVPAEETEAISLSHAALILADADARRYVGAIAYHPYPYGSTYASVPNILSSSGAGAPNAAAVTARNNLRDLGAQYGLPVFMVEVSHSELTFDDFDGVRGRAIQIHDELEHADASAFFGMNALWDSTSHAEHYAGRTDPGFYSEVDTIVLIDNGTGEVRISPMGHAIGHYARWIRRGAVRLGASSSDPLVQISAFVEQLRGQAVIVAINNATAERTLDVSFTGLSVSGIATGEQSTASAIWATLPEASLGQNSTFEFSAPAHSITTWSMPLLGAMVDAGTADAGAGDTTDAGLAGGNGGRGSGAANDGGTSAGTRGTTAGTGGTTAGTGGMTANRGGPSTRADASSAASPTSGSAPDGGRRGGAKAGAGCSCRIAHGEPRVTVRLGLMLALPGLLWARRGRRRRRAPMSTGASRVTTQ